MSMSVPESFLCPISHEIMDDPWIDQDGNSYEKAAIMEWLASRQVSPITRRPLLPANLVPNRVLRTLIEEYKASLTQTPSLPAAPLNRKPIMLFAVIDNSGSMGEPCGGAAGAGEEEDGFSRLDLVKHTMNTIITSLAPQDKLCLIKFSNAAEVIANLTTLTDTNKKVLMEKLKYLVPEYSTNIWDGLRAALEIVATLPEESLDGYNVEVFLLTDGVPNLNPPRPITETMESFLSKRCEGRRPKVHTFGYGYSLQSDVLYDLAKVGNGCFGFIPDSSMVGTVFINSLSSSLVGADPDLRNDVIDEVSARFCTLLRSLLRETAFAQQLALLNRFIADIEDRLREQMNDGAGDARAVDFLESVLLDCKDSTDPNLGQIMKAIQAAFFSKWGKHYLYSVLSAFENQVCINFKDKAMQIFKSEKFKVEQERIEEVFVQLPAPMPSISNHQQYNGYYSGAGSAGQHSRQYASAPAPSAPILMNTYHQASGGCFTADSVVLAVVAGAESQDALMPVQVRDLKAGMRVWSQCGVTEIECMVQLRYQGPIYHVENMKLTAYHPILRKGMAQFPVDCTDAADPAQLDGYVYDLVLSNRSIVGSPLRSQASFPAPVFATAAQDVQCMYVATFGHNVRTGCFEHAYFGTEAVVNDLRMHPDWCKGEICVHEYTFLRSDDEERRVVGMRFGASAVQHSEMVVDKVLSQEVVV